MLLAQSLVRLGAEALIYDPDIDSPASRTVKSSTHASWQDKEALSEFLAACDIATYEFENVPYESLAAIKTSTPLIPSLDVLRITQNRANEKEFLRSHTLPHVPYFIAENAASLKEQINQLSFPVILKSTTGGYDGKAQVLIKDVIALKDMIEKFTSSPLLKFPIIVEQAIDLFLELSCITAHSIKGEKIVFPVFQNVHANHILDTTLVPAEISPDLTYAIQSLARQATDKLNVTGILCTEFFISHKNEKIKSCLTVGEYDVYINEFAPRLIILDI